MLSVLKEKAEKRRTLEKGLARSIRSAYTHERFTFDSSPIVDGMGFPAIVRDGLPGHWLVGLMAALAPQFSSEG